MNTAFSIAYLGPAVYVIRGQDDAVLYVGMSESNWPARIGVHRNTSWGHLIHKVEITPVKAAEIRRIEGRLIRQLRPTYNIMLNFDDSA